MKLTDFEIFKQAKYSPILYKNKWKLNKNLYLDIVLTDCCNQNCAFCIANLKHKKEVLDYEVMKKQVLYAIEQFNIKEVLIVGGEPTLSEDLIKTIKFLKTLPLNKIVMTSNGIKLAGCSGSDKFTRKVFDAGLTHLNISFMNFNETIAKSITGNKHPLTYKGLLKIAHLAKEHKVNIRINNNISAGNNDNCTDMFEFYTHIKNYVDSVKFSPLFPTANFSVIDTKTEWVQRNILSVEKYTELFSGFEQIMCHRHNVSLIENNEQFGFVKNTMIPMTTPIIMNWNFGKYTKPMEKLVKENKINSVKLLSTGDLSLTWNREATEWVIRKKEDIMFIKQMGSP